MRPPEDDAGRIAWIRLARSRNVGPVAFRDLTRRYGSAAKALEIIPELSARGGRPMTPAAQAAAESEWTAARKLGARFLPLGDPAYPPLLARIHAPPPFLWVLGRIELLARDGVAIVGARNASALGMKFAQTLARDLGREGLCVVSGMARGVDAAAHAGAMGTGTVAVLGGGPDDVYPADNAALYAELKDKGAILSESPPGHKAQAQDFPRRNRIVAGLALGVVVAEAAERSGSLITARLASEEGREVMAAPGSPVDARAGGSNLLIREGATLIRHAADVMEALALQRIHRNLEEDETPCDLAPPRGDGDAEERAREALLRLIGPSPVELDLVIRSAGLDPGAAALAALELELAGRLIREAGGRVALAPPS